jgi:cyclopropane-fatty-acyl-phospholipid synthase
MSITASSNRPAPLPANPPRAARAVMRLLERLSVGVLDVHTPAGDCLRFAGSPSPHASIRLGDWGVCGAVLRSGDIGFAEAYVAGRWTTPDLAALLGLFVANRDAIEAAVYGTWWGAALHRLRHALRRNTRRGSRKNIHAHYDVGNDFYRLWLDETMSYSSALFAGDLSRSTESAQTAKMRRALRQCGIAPGGRLLEIGCGWGALAETAVTEFGARVVGITLSNEQFDHAQARLRSHAGQAAVRLQDYRDLDDGPFDAVVSIEMFEAVGREYWKAFFGTLARSLKSGARACIQTITIDDRLFERYRRSTDFIQQYIFPGGLLPSRQAFRALAAGAGLAVEDEFAFGADYAETLRRWRTRFHARLAEVRALGFDERFVRIWDFYLAYCEAAFVAGSTDVVQFTLRKP